MAKLVAAVKTFLTEECAPTAVEYGVMVALIAAVVIGGATALGINTDAVFTSVAGTISGVAP